MEKLFGKYRGRVEDNVDPRELGRVQVSCPAALGPDSVEWAVPCLPFCGPDRGFLMLPPVGAGVWIEFEAGDPASPIWTGCLPETEVGPGSGPDDVMVAGAGGHRLVLGGSGGEVSLLHSSGSTVRFEAGGDVTVTATSKVRASAAAVEVTAGIVTIDAGVVRVSGVLQCDTVIATSVVAASYTPGAGNIW